MRPIKKTVNLEELRELIAPIMPIIELYIKEHPDCNCENCSNAKKLKRFFSPNEKHKRKLSMSRRVIR